MPPASTWDLAGISLFDDLEPEGLAEIAPWFEVQETSPGVNLTGEGAAGYSFFVLSDGTASVTIDGTEVNALGPGDFFGELAILGDGRRTATVTTTSPARLLVLFGTEFRRLQQEQPELASQIEAGVRARLQPAA
jgi:CRP/FNR family transcriptional regulator, cyclic AMP receptor protein